MEFATFASIYVCPETGKRYLHGKIKNSKDSYLETLNSLAIHHTFDLSHLTYYETVKRKGSREILKMSDDNFKKVKKNTH